MMNSKILAAAAALSCLLAGSPAAAHHSFAAEFDASQPVRLTGTVTKIDWLNPHVWFYVDVKDENGAITNWGFEMTSPNVLMRQGWTRESMKIGDTVTVDGSRARDSSNTANARVVVLANSGQRLFAGSNPDERQ
jgi:hypothetical protein